MVKANPQSTHRWLLVAFIVTVVIGIAIFAAGWVYIIKISSNQSKLNTEAKNFSNENAVLSDLKLDLARLGKDQEVVYHIIPQTKDVSAFLAAFESTVKADNLSISGVNVGDIQKKSKTGSDLSQTVSKDQYYELPIKYEVSGDYMNLTKLFSDLTNGRRLVSVSNVVVSGDYSDKNANGKIKSTFLVTVYIKK